MMMIRRLSVMRDRPWRSVSKPCFPRRSAPFFCAAASLTHSRLAHSLARTLISYHERPFEPT